MRLELTGRHVDVSPALRRLVDRKLSRLERILNDSAVSAQVVLTREKNWRRADVTLHARGEKFLHGFGASDNWAESMTGAIDKIVQQAKKVKGKWLERKRRGRRPAGEPAVIAAERPGNGGAAPVQPLRPHMPPILRASRQELRAMSVADAAREVQHTEEGVVVFRDSQTAGISVLFRRTNGELTLVETET
jgi:putative sigma-54 modulation protein